MPSAPKPPKVRLGSSVGKGVAPSMFGLLERGVERRPAIARSMRGKVVLRFDESFAPVRITFTAKTVTVEDGDFHSPDVAISGSLPDIVHFATAPHVRGVPNPARGRGLAALARVASRRVRVSGDRALARKLLRLLAL
ncbi:MAG TPA: hypothetical protein VHI33_01955 [Solirubrobacterales bacterium]|nr:hypothetical protein [Solirubrobacterales bacterium]